MSEKRYPGSKEEDWDQFYSGPERAIRQVGRFFAGIRKRLSGPEEPKPEPVPRKFEPISSFEDKLNPLQEQSEGQPVNPDSLTTEDITALYQQVFPKKDETSIGAMRTALFGHYNANPETRIEAFEILYGVRQGGWSDSQHDRYLMNLSSRTLI